MIGWVSCVYERVWALHLLDIYGCQSSHRLKIGRALGVSGYLLSICARKRPLGYDRCIYIIEAIDLCYSYFCHFLDRRRAVLYMISP